MCAALASEELKEKYRSSWNLDIYADPGNGMMFFRLKGQLLFFPFSYQLTAASFLMRSFRFIANQKLLLNTVDRKREIYNDRVI
jgi:hypothetical protein